MLKDSNNTSSKDFQRRIIVIGATACVLIATLLGAVFAYINDGFGMGEVGSVLFWTIPLGLGTTGVHAFLWRRLDYQYSRFTVALAIFTGVLGGYLWTLFVAWIFGPWFGAFSLPVLYCWITGGVAGNVFSIAVFSQAAGGRRSAPMIVATLIVMAAVFGVGYLRPVLTGDQYLRVLFLRQVENDGELSLISTRWDDWDELGVSVDELRATGLRGALRFSSSTGIGNGAKIAQVIIVGRHQIGDPVELPQPDATKIIYYQSDEGEWIKHPPDAPTLARVIRLTVASHTDKHTLYRVEHASGAASGGTAFTWE